MTSIQFLCNIARRSGRIFGVHFTDRQRRVAVLFNLVPPHDVVGTGSAAGADSGSSSVWRRADKVFTKLLPRRRQGHPK